MPPKDVILAQLNVERESAAAKIAGLLTGGKTAEAQAARDHFWKCVAAHPGVCPPDFGKDVDAHFNAATTPR